MAAPFIDIVIVSMFCHMYLLLPYLEVHAAPFIETVIVAINFGAIFGVEQTRFGHLKLASDQNEIDRFIEIKTMLKCFWTRSRVLDAFEKQIVLVTLQ